jgi:hypothetical protein
MTPDAADAGNKPRDQNWFQLGLRSGVGQAVRWVLVLALLTGHWLATVLGPVSGHGRWLTDASLVLGQKGNPGSFESWLPVLIISVLLLLPDLDSVALGGLKLETRRTREDIAALRQQITMMSVQAQRQDQHLSITFTNAVTGLATTGAVADSAERETADDAEYAAPDQFTRLA